MTRLTLRGDTVYTEGTLPLVGQIAPKLTLTTSTLEDVGLEHFGVRTKRLLIAPSFEMQACAGSLRRFSELLRCRSEVTLLAISQDLPIADRRVFASVIQQHAVALSAFRSPQFARSYGVDIVSGPLKGSIARAVLVLDGRNRVLYAHLMRDLAAEPDYTAALAALPAPGSRCVNAFTTRMEHP
jgi:thioredoxin-dependent peroxiredoxin